MTIETLMTQATTTTTEGQAASQPAAEQPATGADDDGQQQQQPIQEQGAQGQQPAADASRPSARTRRSRTAHQQYEFQVPEGVALDDGVMGAFSEVARELNLPRTRRNGCSTRCCL